MTHIEEIAHETGKEMPIYEAQETIEFLGFSIENWYDSQPHPLNAWCAFSKGIGNTSAPARECAIHLIENKILWGTPTLPIMHMNGSGDMLQREAKALKDQILQTFKSAQESKLKAPGMITIRQVLSALNEYVQAHLKFFKNKDRIESRTITLLNKWEFTETKFEEHFNTIEIKKLLKDLKLTFQLFKKWEFNARDYYPIEGSWEHARKERNTLSAMISYTTEELSYCRVKLPKKSKNET
jgi:hypothetical protein